MFKRGHVVAQEDISQLLDLGKKHLYVWDLNAGFVHEDEAAQRMAKAMAGQGITLTTPSEGKVQMMASTDGLIKINLQGLEAINCIEDVMVASIHENQSVKEGDPLAGTRIIPLVIKEPELAMLEKVCESYRPIFEVKPFRKLNIGIVTTGSEVFEGRIKDGFGPVLRQKISASGSCVLDQVFVSDSIQMIVEAIHRFRDQGADLILVTGGMSVDPDDVTPEGIRQSGAHIVTYGAPVLPGAMFLLAYLNQIPVLGLPGCVMYNRTSVFDLVYPRIQAGEILGRKDIIRWAHGGFCLGCETCRWPNCSFGK